MCHICELLYYCYFKFDGKQVLYINFILNVIIESYRGRKSILDVIVERSLVAKNERNITDPNKFSENKSKFWIGIPRMLKEFSETPALTFLINRVLEVLGRGFCLEIKFLKKNPIF